MEDLETALVTWERVTVMLAEYGPLAAAFAAVLAAVLAYRSSRHPTLPPEEREKIKSEIEAGQLKTQQEKALAEAVRNRYLVRLENWAYQDVRPWSHKAVGIIDSQNIVLAELCSKEGIPFEPKHLPELPDPPRIDDKVE